jgi:hypothetical protein
MRELVESGDVDIMDRFTVDFSWIEELQANESLTVDISDSTEVTYYAMTEGGALASPEAARRLPMRIPTRR